MLGEKKKTLDNQGWNIWRHIDININSILSCKDWGRFLKNKNKGALTYSFWSTFHSGIPWSLLFVTEKAVEKIPREWKLTVTYGDASCSGFSSSLGPPLDSRWLLSWNHLVVARNSVLWSRIAKENRVRRKGTCRLTKYLFFLFSITSLSHFKPITTTWVSRNSVRV